MILYGIVIIPKYGSHMISMTFFCRGFYGDMISTLLLVDDDILLVSLQEQSNMIVITFLGKARQFEFNLGKTMS